MRDSRIDILRFIGLAMIIFCHVRPPGFLFQLRNFDVPLMVLVSGMSFGMSFNSNEPYIAYLWKRFKRLIFPVWIFLTIYFTAQHIFFSESTELNFKFIFNSYLFVGGIGYLWIIRVFLLVALVSPLLYYLNKKCHSYKKTLVIVFISFFSYEILRYFSLPYIQEGAGKIVSLYVLYIIPYAIIFYLGLLMLQMNKRQIYTFCIINLFIFILIGLLLFIYNGKIIKTQTFKYPPSIYYFSYALFVSNFLWLCINQIDCLFEKINIKNLVLFIANNSIWIYLWHIPLIKVINTNFFLKYFAVFAIAASITYIQVWGVNNLLIKRVYSEGVRKNIKILLTG